MTNDNEEKRIEHVWTDKDQTEIGLICEGMTTSINVNGAATPHGWAAIMIVCASMSVQFTDMPDDLLIEEFRKTLENARERLREVSN